MSADDLYRVLYIDADGHEQLTGAMSYEAAQSRARDLQGQGHTVGSVMGDVAARGYMHARYAPTYRGVKIPDDLRSDGVPRSALEAWKRGVDAELDGAAPKPAAVHRDYRWLIRIHWDSDHVSPAVGPFGQTEADNRMRELRRRYRDAGMKPPRMERELLRSPDVLDGWIQEDIDRAEQHRGGDDR